MCCASAHPLRSHAGKKIWCVWQLSRVYGIVYGISCDPANRLTLLSPHNFSKHHFLLYFEETLLPALMCGVFPTRVVWKHIILNYNLYAWYSMLSYCRILTKQWSDITFAFSYLHKSYAVKLAFNAKLILKTLFSQLTHGSSSNALKRLLVLLKTHGTKHGDNLCNGIAINLSIHILRQNLASGVIILSLAVCFIEKSWQLHNAFFQISYNRPSLMKPLVHVSPGMSVKLRTFIGKSCGYLSPS